MTVETSAAQSSEPVDPAQFGNGGREHVSRQRAEQVRALQAHAGVFIVGMAVMFGVNLVTNLTAGTAGSWSAWWSVWALVGWSAGVMIHGLVVWLNRPLLPAGEAVRSES